MEVSGGVAVGIVATALGVAVATAKLLGATYAHDVATVCNAESASGFVMSRNAARVSQWTQDQLRTPEGGRLLAALRDLPLAERPRWLEERSRAAGVSNCPMVQVYDELSREWDARRELQRLCSTATFPDLERLDEAGRRQVIDEWFELHGVTAQARSLRSRLRGTQKPAGRAEVLSDAANGLGVLTCDVAKILATPVSQSCDP
jgi:hypothetical protein